ncbi:hypothetical protein, partial [Actinoallomurus acaciae]|uniref:hypothetical protein n=1 Tax=Actinoallomurus acaciae TaxID=502577 RepID=UPI00366FD022
MVPEKPVTPGPRPVHHTVPLEELLADTRVGLADGVPVGLWLPGAPEHGLGFDEATIGALGELVPPQTVFVVGAEHDGRVVVDGRPVSVETLYATIAAKAPGMQPFLLIPGAAEMAEPLARRFEGPVLAAPDGMRFDPDTGLTFLRPVEDGPPAPEPFRLYEPGLPAGLPIAASLNVRPEQDHDSSESAVPPPPAVHVVPPTPVPSPTDGASAHEASLPRSRPISPRHTEASESTIFGPYGEPVERAPSPAPSADTPDVQDQPLDEMARSIGVPRAGLPYMRALLAGIDFEMGRRGRTFTEKQKADLVQRLLANYPYLLGSSAENNTSGLVVPIGSTELLITFDPRRPQRVVRNPAGSYATPSRNAAPDGSFVAVDTINAAYGTGAHTDTHSGQTGATRGKVGLTFGIGATPGVLNVVKVGASVSGVANQSNRSTTNVKDAERGKVEDSRIEAELISYPEVNISFKIREQRASEDVRRWQDLTPFRVPESGGEALLLWVARPYTEDQPASTVTATGPEVDARRGRLPRNYHASGLTNIPRLFDEVLRMLRGQGLRLPTGNVTREELLQKLTNLNTHLDSAVNDRDGYRITLHDARGKKIAIVRVHSELLHPETAPQIGAVSDKVHLEDVRTAIDGSSGSHTVTGSTTITPLSGEFDLLPNPTGIKDLGLNIGASGSYTKTRTDTLSAGRTGLWVLVPRYTGLTAAYGVRFRHRATVSVLGGRGRRETDAVEGAALVRMPVKEAFGHGFAVDRDTLKNPPAEDDTMPYAPDAVRGSGRRPDDPPAKDVPLHVQEGKGVGMGLVRVSDDTVDALRTMVEEEVRRYGFLPRDRDDPFAGHHWYSNGSRLRRRLDNQDLLKKMISTQGLDSHYDQIHQDGMSFTLRLSGGGAGLDLDFDSVKVTVKARKGATPPRYVQSTNEYHTVNLAMGMDTMGQGVSQARKLAVGVSLRGLYKYLKAAAMGVEFQRTVGAADSVGFLNNRPELLEFPGEVDEFVLTSDYELGFEYAHSAGKRLRKPPPPDLPRRPGPPRLPNQTAVVHLLPLGTADQRGPVQEATAPADLLDQGLVYFVDTTGLRELAGRALTDLRRVDRAADADIDTFAGTISVRAHLREILKSEYTTDRLFDTGLFRDTFGALDISGELHDVEFSGSTGEKFVKGDIKLTLLENRLTDNSSLGITWDQLDVAGGGDAGHAVLTGEADANRHSQWNTATAAGRTGGKELIQLDFNHAYAFAGKVHLALSARQEKHSKLMPGGTPRHLTGERLGPRTMMFLLSEPEALKRYAERSVPISDAQLTDALTRWQNGDLTLSGDTAGRVLTRWRADLVDQWDRLEGVAVWESEYPDRLRQVAGFADALVRMHRTGQEPVRDAQVRQDFDAAFERPAPLEAPRDPFGPVDMSGSRDLLDYANGAADLPDQRLTDAMNAWRNGDLTLGGDVVARILARWMTELPGPPQGTDHRLDLVTLLYDLHARGALPIWQAKTRERFERLPGARPLPTPKTPLEHLELPEYLRREDPGGRLLGHSGIQTYRHDNGQTTYQLVRRQIEAVAPGMLAAGADIWDRNGRVVGRMQGGVDALQSMYAEGRDVGLFEEFLSTNGYSFYVVDPVGWLLADVVEVNLSSVLTSAPKIGEFVPNTGIEVYGHGYRSSSVAKSKDGSQALTFAKFGTGGRPDTTASDAVAAKASEGHHRGTTRAETGVTEQTVYDWSGHYLTGFDEEMTIRVRRLAMSGRPLNNLLMTAFDKLAHRGRTAQETVPGRLEIQVPRAIAEGGVARGPATRRDLAPLPKLPGNAFVAGTMIDDALPIAQKMLAQVFEPGAVARMFGAKAADPEKESSRSLPVLLSRLHLTNHLRDATGGDTYQVAKGLIMPGDADVRADLYLRGELYDLQVIAPMKEGTGTGRYNKHQSGTTASAGTDQVRLEGDYQLDGSGHMSHHHADQAPHTWDFQDSGSRVTSMNQNSAGTENYRREQHAKEQGPVHMVRLRFRGRLEAEKFEHHLFRRPTYKGRFRSDPITGDVYAELFEAEVDELRVQLERERAAARPDAEAWPDMRRAPGFDLAPLLLGALENRLEASRAYQHVARHIRTRIGGDRPVVLTADDRNLAIQRYRATLSWAVETMRADLVAARRTAADTAEPANLRAFEARLHHLRLWEQGHTGRHPALRIGPNGQPAVAPDLATAIDQDVDVMIRAVQTARDDMNTAIAGAPVPGASLGVLPALPAEISMLGQHPVHLARDVAHDLNAHVRIDVRRPDGSTRQTWLDPDGGVHTFDPARTRVDATGHLHIFDGRAEQPFTADLAHRHGLLPDRHRADVITFALDDAGLGRLYRNAMAGRQTFEQAVAEEIAARRARLDTVHAGLSQRVRQAYEAYEFWRSDLEWRRAEERAIRDRIEASDTDAAALADRLEEVRETPDATERVEQARRILDRLRRAARPDAPGRLSPGAVRRIGLRLDDLTSLGRLLQAARVRRTDLPDVPQGLALTDAYLSVNADGRTVLHRRHEESRGIGPARPLAEYAPVFWITHGAPDEGATVEDIVGTDWTAATEFLTADRDVSLSQRVHQALRLSSDRLIETSDELPDRPPAGTWVMFDGDAAAGAAVVLADGRYRTYVPGAEIRVLPAEDVRREAGGRPRFVIAEPEDQLPLLLRPLRSGADSEPPRDRDEEHGSTRTDDPPPADPHLYRNASGDHRVGERGLAQDGWRHVGALSEFAPLSWLTHRAPAHGVTAVDVMRTGLPAAVRFFAHVERAGERADAVRAYLAEEPGRDVEVTRRLPESLPPDTWVWFTDRAGTGAGYLHPDGTWRIFAPGATLRAEDGARRLSGASRTFVVGRPATDAAVTRPAPLAREAEPFAAGPLPPRPGDLSRDGVAPSAGEDERSRLPAAHRGWAGDETAESLRRLEARLRRAGPRALALVTLQEPD